MIKIFLGHHQGKIPVAMARALQALGSNVEYIQASGGGKNAVDFHIAYYIGRLAATAADTHFHVISKDAGFDPLIEHLKEQGIFCRRSPSIAAIPTAPTTICGSDSVADRAKAVVANLTKRKSGKPQTLKTLRSTIKALLGQPMEEDLDRIIEHLTDREVIKIAEGKVQYTLPT